MERLMDGLLAVVLIAAAGWGAYAYGGHEARAADALAEKGRTAAAVKLQADADDKVLANERKQRQADAATFTTYRKEHENADQTTERVVADLRADNRRLRIPVQYTVRSAAPAAGGSAAGGPGEEGRADLTAGASEFLVRLTARGDEAIRKHAAVVDAYDHLRAACTAALEQAPEATPHE